MKINKYIYAGLVAGALCLTTSCSESELADINTNPSVVTTPDIRYLFTQVFRISSRLSIGHGTMTSRLCADMVR